jgi:hypothetical protein
MVFEGHVTLALRADQYPCFVSGGRGLRGPLFPIDSLLRNLHCQYDGSKGADLASSTCLDLSKKNQRAYDIT